METLNLLTGLVENHQVLAYILIYLGIIFEGDLFLISTGILAHLGALDFGFSLAFILLGGFSKTFFGYALGEFLQKRFNHHRVFQYIERRVYGVFPRFKTHPFWHIFVSKFLMSTNYLVIIFCGYEKIDYKKFLQAEVSSTLIWAPGLLTLGYFFSYAAFNITREVSKFLLVLFILYIIFVLFDKLVTWLYEMFEEFYHAR